MEIFGEENEEKEEINFNANTNSTDNNNNNNMPYSTSDSVRSMEKDFEEEFNSFDLKEINEFSSSETFQDFFTNDYQSILQSSSSNNTELSNHKINEKIKAIALKCLNFALISNKTLEKLLEKNSKKNLTMNIDNNDQMQT